MYNKVILIGRVASDLELKTTPSGVYVTNFRLAVNRAHDRNKADFISVVAWRNNAEFVCKYFSKGSAIGIDGTMQSREYTDKNGNKRIEWEVQADRVFFVGSKGKESAADAPMTVSNESSEVLDDDDLPF